MGASSYVSRMIRFDNEDRAILRSVVRVTGSFDRGAVVRVDFLGGWPLFEVVAAEGEALVVRRLKTGV
jgi:hypothetical protein